MGDLWLWALRVLLCVFALLSAGPRDAFADRIGGSNLPSSTPTLKGRISDGEGATSVAVVSTAVGWTTNAGPTFSETPSTFVDRGMGYATTGATSFGRLDFSMSLGDRHFVSFNEANERSAQASLSLTWDWEGQQTILAFAASHGSDIEERLTQARLSITHAWTEGRVKPYVQAETAVLNYHDMPGDIFAFANQDDRDRISSRAQIGLRATITEHLAVEVGAGIDSKHYLDGTDDFGVRRDSLSLFPLVGFAYTAERLSLSAVYMPFRRSFDEALFSDTWKHGYAAEAEIKLSDALKAFASARHGFEETDFLIASAAYESVVVAGLMLTGDRGTLSLAASETRRDYDGLGLLGLERLDRKREMALSGDVPLFDSVSLNGRVSYMDFQTSLGRVGTDVLTVSLGMTYAATE